MGRSRYKIYDPQAPYFLTCTINNWIPIFTRQATAQVVIEALAYRRSQRDLKIYGYVILENHIHLIAQSSNLQKEISNFKSWTAKQILIVLKSIEPIAYSSNWSFTRKRIKKDRQYQVWEEGSHPQQIQNEKMLLQKLDYIHLNPVKRGYVDKVEHWCYSSARNYLGFESLLDIDTSWV